MSKPSLLILSFSPIYRDARLLKQLRMFRDDYAVTTVGYGGQPMEGVKHIEVPIEQGMWRLNGRMITLKMYSKVYWSLDGVDWVWKKLKGRDFDVVLANDYDTVPIGVRLKPRGGVHADLHEYAPSQAEENDAWRRRIAPWRAWVLKTYATKAQSWTTVSQGLADRFQKEFGFYPDLVTNAAPYANLEPSPTHSPLRLVYQGVANKNRGLDQTIRAVADSTADIIFDMYIPRPTSGWMEVLQELAAPDPRISVNDAVPYAELIPLLNTYDVGISVLPPNTFNLEYSLPNKIFDYVQARLGIITGPSPEMAKVVQQNDVGLVLPDFEPGSLTDAVNSLSADQVRVWKEHANGVARALSSEEQNEGWERPIRELARRAVHP